MILEVHNLTKKFDDQRPRITGFHDVSFSVDKGEFFAVVGPSGCGKSTLLRVIAGLMKPTSGAVSWEQVPNTGFVFQNYALFPYLTVYQNIEFGLKMHNAHPQKRSQIVQELIREVGLTGFESKHPSQLSGGMRQRVGIARSLAISPDVLMLDEPFSSLDEFTSESLRKLLIDLWKARGITVVMITHLIREALELADRIAVMTPHPGTIERVVTNTLERPRNLRSDKFFKLHDYIRGLIRI